MNSRAILGISLAAIFVMTMVTLPAFAHFTWQGIITDAITPKNANTTVLSITTSATVPPTPQIPILAGFAWLYSAGPNGAFAITLHNAGNVNGDASEPPNDVRDSTQNPDGWHAHNVNLGAGTASSTFCVTAIVDAPNAGIGIKGSQIDVQIKNSVLTGTLGTATAGFDIIIDGACGITAGTGSTTAGPLPLGIVVHGFDP